MVVCPGMRLIPLVFITAACGGGMAESPLTIPLGITHAATDQALHAHQFCRKEGQVDARQQLYPRCDRAGAEVSEAWVTAIFEGDRLVELRRWERFADDARALERWNELLAARMKASTPSEEALQGLRDKGELQAGTKSVKAFRADDGAIVGVFLLTPSPPENAAILEKITYPK